jgi:DNA-binding MarR family transcriptional regulator
MIESTSLKAWYELQNSLGAAQKTVLDEIRKEPSTIREIAHRLDWDAGSVSARIKELMKAKLIERPLHQRTGEQIKVRCKITGKTAYLHQAISPLPPAMKPVEITQQKLL